MCVVLTHDRNRQTARLKVAEDLGRPISRVAEPTEIREGLLGRADPTLLQGKEVAWKTSKVLDVSRQGLEGGGPVTTY